MQDYVRHFTEDVLRALERAPGFRGAQVLSNAESEPVELVVVTWWTSRDAMHAFAGAEIGRAVIDPEAREMLVSCDDTVTHYTVVAEHAAAPRVP